MTMLPSSGTHLALVGRMTAKALADRVAALEAKVGSKTIAEEFREQAELIDKLFIYRFDENDKRWNARFRGLERDVGVLKTDVSALKTDVGVLKTEVSALKTDVSALKTDVGVLKTDVSALKTDVGALKTDVSVLKTDVGVLKKDMVIVREGIGILLKKHS